MLSTRRAPGPRLQGWVGAQWKVGSGAPGRSRELGVSWEEAGGHKAPPSGDAVQDAQHEGESSRGKFRWGRTSLRTTWGLGHAELGRPLPRAVKAGPGKGMRGSLSTTVKIRPPLVCISSRALGREAPEQTDKWPGPAGLQTAGEGEVHGGQSHTHTFTHKHRLRYTDILKHTAGYTLQHTKTHIHSTGYTQLAGYTYTHNSASAPMQL